MKQRGIRLACLLWLGWYLSGPLIETIDFWDSPQEEITDIARCAGGVATLIAVGICSGFALLGKMGERCWRGARRFGHRKFAILRARPTMLVLRPLWSANSPPAPLRI